MEPPRCQRHGLMIRRPVNPRPGMQMWECNNPTCINHTLTPMNDTEPPTPPAAADESLTFEKNHAPGYLCDRASDIADALTKHMATGPRRTRQLKLALHHAAETCRLLNELRLPLRDPDLAAELERPISVGRAITEALYGGKTYPYGEPVSMAEQEKLARPDPPRIVIEKGRAMIQDTNILAAAVWACMNSGAAGEGPLSRWPQLTQEDLDAVRAYYEKEGQPS